ncbi:MAG: O-methyltransferase [Chitinophagaceae bacterium]
MHYAIELGYKYLRYLFTSANGKGHGIHPPFVFELVTKVLNDNRSFYAFSAIENLRKELQNNSSVITIQDFGAGSRVYKSNERKIKDIAHSSLKAKKYGQLLFKLVDFYKPKTIVELGTCLGTTTAYLASANHAAKVYTFEGAQSIAAIAEKNFQQLNIQNIHQVLGNFDETVPKWLEATKPVIDFAFLDGNHSFEPTVRYFNALIPFLQNNSLVVVDDIHWSEGMEKAWYTIQQHPSVTLTIDLFSVGLVFFRKEQLAKQHFIIRY